MMTMAMSKSNPNIPPARVDCTKCDTPTAAPAYNNPGPRRESTPLKFPRSEDIVFAWRGDDGEERSPLHTGWFVHDKWEFGYLRIDEIDVKAMLFCFD